MEMYSKPTVHTDIGKHLKQLRTGLGLTQEQVAERASIAVTYYSNVERGTRGVSVDVLCRLAKALGTSTDSILFGKSDSPGLDRIHALLKDRPEAFVCLIEKTIRFYLGNGIGTE